MTFSETTLRTRRTRVAAALALADEILLVGAGQPVPLPENTDQTYPFNAHTEYFYLTGLECPGGVVAFDPRDTSADHGGWRSFVPDVSEAERIWEGRAQPPGESITGLEPWLTQRRGRTLVTLGAALRGIEGDAARTIAVRERFHHARRPKDAAELALLQRAAVATAAGYEAVQPLLRAGITERALQIELEAAFYRSGATRTGYGTIVGSGPNSAILHTNPSSRAAREGEFILIDAGAEVDRYVIDVTRTYVAGTPTAFQRDLYQIVLGAEDHAIAGCLAGAEWKDLHLRCAVEMVNGLVFMGVMRGKAESLVEQEAHTLFFPHGLGHLVGLGVRDASGTLPGRVKDPRASLKNLRTDLPLAPGYVITVEPGLYFIPALLNDPKRRERFKDAVDWTVADAHLDLGGVRIEDNVLITDGQPEVLTRDIPKTL